MNTYEAAILPEQLKRARNAIDLPEVQQMMKRLADFGLGICMPHMHTEQAAFSELPLDYVQVECAGNVSFQPRMKLKNSGFTEVAWRWQDNGSIAGAVCNSYCVTGHSPVHGDYHKTMHSKS